MLKSRKIALLRCYLFIQFYPDGYQSVANTIAIYLLLTNLLDFIHSRTKKYERETFFYGFGYDKFIHVEVENAIASTRGIDEIIW